MLDPQMFFPAMIHASDFFFWKSDFYYLYKWFTNFCNFLTASEFYGITYVNILCPFLVFYLFGVWEGCDPHTPQKRWEGGLYIA
jgi:hypothetical protein